MHNPNKFSSKTKQRLLILALTMPMITVGKGLEIIEKQYLTNHDKLLLLRAQEKRIRRQDMATQKQAKDKGLI